MSKRLSDTEVWKKSWFYELEPKFKLFWFYILSDCDAAGIWAVNLRLAENILQVKLDAGKILELLKDQIVVLNAGHYWFIVDFIRFQYGYPLSETSPMRKKLTELLRSKKLNLDTLFEDINTVSIQYQYSIDTIKDKDKDINKDKEKDITKYSADFLKFWEVYPKAVSKKKSFESWQKAKDKPAIEQILAKIELQKKTEQWQKDNGQFIPMSTTYINQARWDDKMEVKKLRVVL